MKAAALPLLLVAMVSCRSVTVPDHANDTRDTLVAGFALPRSLFTTHASMDSMGTTAIEGEDERITISAGTCSPNEVDRLLQEHGWSLLDSCGTVDETIIRATRTTTHGHGNCLIRLSRQGSRLFPGKYACSKLEQTSQGPSPRRTVMAIDSAYARLCQKAP